MNFRPFMLYSFKTFLDIPGVETFRPVGVANIVAGISPDPTDGGPPSKESSINISISTFANDCGS